jgi:hypothetical protein
LVLILRDDRQLSEESEGDDEEVEVVPFKTADEDLDKTCLSHFFFNGRVRADVKKDVEADEEKLVLLPDQHVQYFELLFGADPVLLVVLAPHLDVLAVEEVEALDLVFEDVHDGDTHFVLGQQLLKLLVVAQDVKDAQYVDRQVDVSFVIFGQCSTEDRQERIYMRRGIPCSRRVSRLAKSWNN